MSTRTYNSYTKLGVSAQPDSSSSGTFSSSDAIEQLWTHPTTGSIVKGFTGTRPTGATGNGFTNPTTAVVQSTGPLP